MFPPRPSMRIVATRSRSARPTCRDGTRSRSPATTSARRARPRRRSWRSRWPTVSPTSRWRADAGLDVDAFAPRLCFFFNAHIDFFEEIAKYRAARRIWARWMTRALRRRKPSVRCSCRFHTQTAGVSLTAQQPEVNIARTAIEALGRRARRHAEHAHQLDGRGARACPPSRRLASRCARSRSSPTRRVWPTWPIRSAARGSSRSSPTRSERQAEADVRPPRRAGRRFDSRGRVRRHRRSAGSRARSPMRPTSSSRSSTLVNG